MFGVFSQIFINLIPPLKSHIDKKDAGYCFIFYLGDFDETHLFLPNLGLDVHFKLGDLIMLKSSKVFHQACPSVKGVTKYSVIMTTHTNLITTCINKCNKDPKKYFVSKYLVLLCIDGFLS